MNAQNSKHYKMSAPSRPIASQPPRSASNTRSPFSNSYMSSSPIAQESLARDLAECSDDEDEAPDSGERDESDDASSEASTVRPAHRDHSMASSYRRPSFVAFGGTRPAITPHSAENTYMSKKERKQSRAEERSLLRDKPSRSTKAWAKFAKRSSVPAI